MNINLTPSLPPGTWVRGTLTLTIADYQNPISGEPSPWDGNAPNAVFLTKVGVNDITVRFDGSRGPSTLTQYWWVPVTEDGQEGFVLGVL